MLAALCHKVLTILRIIQAFEKYNVEKDVAEQIKKEFDKRHGPTWHCIVGRNFGNFFLFIIVNDFFTWVYSDLWFISLFSSGN